MIQFSKLTNSMTVQCQSICPLVYWSVSHILLSGWGWGILPSMLLSEHLFTFILVFLVLAFLCCPPPIWARQHPEFTIPPGTEKRLPPPPP